MHIGSSETTTTDDVIEFIEVETEIGKLCNTIKNTINQMSQLGIPNKQKDQMFKIFLELFEGCSRLNQHLVEEDNGMNPIEAIESTKNFISSAINEVKTNYKRSKMYSDNPYYVAPVEKAVGTRIEMVYDEILQIEKPRLIQSSLQYISVIDSLKAFFKIDENRKAYFDYNENHKCVDGVYERFCCSKQFESNDFFKSNRNALQIVFATDDCEICNPLGSKKNLHKICPVYFTIKNLPPRFNSKLQNIFLAVLCNSDDLKTRQTDFNNIWELLAREIKYLQTHGIQLDDGTAIKGSLVHLSCDNLGANTAYGLTESFNATFYCRICTLPKQKCQVATKEDITMYRNSKDYDKIIEKIREHNTKSCNKSIESSEKLDLKDTLGVKWFCVLNTIKDFDIFSNKFVDITHDLEEGVIPLILRNVFSVCIQKKVFKLDKLKLLISFYKYPKNYRRDKPSNLIMDNNSLNQSAAQMKCLFLNLPFILYAYKDNEYLRSVWKAVSYLLRIYQIVYSEKVDEAQLKELKQLIYMFLEFVKTIINLSLTPKLHLMTHYCTVIKEMGPLLEMRLLRFEGKHKELKAIANKSNNFININKTIAVRHQERKCMNMNVCHDSIFHSKKLNVKTVFLKTILPDIPSIFFQNTFEIKSLFLNSYKYEQKSVFIYDHFLYEIEIILTVNSKYYFIARKVNIFGLDDYSQSLKVEVSALNTNELIEFEKITHKKPYAVKHIADESFIIFDNVDILRDIHF